MDTLEQDRQSIQNIISEHQKIPYSYGEISRYSVFDCDRDHYLLMIVGWEGVRQVHGCIIHIQIMNSKIWIHRDGTENGVANELLEAGIPKERIVLAFKSPELRQHTGFAIA